MSVLKVMRTVAQIAGYSVFLFGIAGAFVVVLVAFFHLFIFFSSVYHLRNICHLNHMANKPQYIKMMKLNGYGAV